mmetsp:Transcript_5154/g.13435  ORF Transcript_5154/g.13435 Transcript_5154/m.13435 type:complete len:110 (-) Transcript_5154:328-657(-)
MRALARLPAWLDPVRWPSAPAALAAPRPTPRRAASTLSGVADPAAAAARDYKFLGAALARRRELGVMYELDKPDDRSQLDMAKAVARHVGLTMPEIDLPPPTKPPPTAE